MAEYNMIVQSEERRTIALNQIYDSNFKQTGLVFFKISKQVYCFLLCTAL